jgi:hypothetical protein
MYRVEDLNTIATMGELDRKANEREYQTVGENYAA